LKKLFVWFVGIVSGVAILGIALIGPIDNTPLAEKHFFQNTLHRLDTFRAQNHPAKGHLKVGWARINITPRSTMPMAGYAPRYQFDSVHDSIFVRILAIDNGGITCYIISADLLIFPPLLKEKLLSQSSPNRFLYFAATHAHSSLGGWDNSALGNVILGSYHEEWLDSLARKVTSTMDSVAHHLQDAKLNYFEADAGEWVENRLDPEHGQTDGKIRGLKIVRADGSRGLFATYGAHPTNISHLSRALSGDYPGALIRSAELRDYNFAMFAGGMMGSHRVKGIPDSEFAMCDSLGARLYKKISTASSIAVRDSSIATSVLPIDFGPSQLHVLQEYKVRDWVFRGLFRKLKGDFRYMKIGNLIFLGAPCDFSGEIFVRDHLGELAAKSGNQLLITSFDGDYVGYITYDDHFGHSEQEEIMAMNWVGPNYGNYFSQIVQKIVEEKPH
jgi:hypothetical protein